MRNEAYRFEMRLAAGTSLFIGLSVLSGCGDTEATVVCPVATPTRCSDACADLMTDRAHCGTCGTACGEGQVCLDSTCSTFCPTGQLADDAGSCVNIESDPANCGAPGAACTPGEVCVSGTCSVTCLAPQAVCGDRCVDLQSDVSHCGECDLTCAPDLACHRGTCIDPCEGLPTTDGRPLIALSMLVPLGNEARIGWAYAYSRALRELGIVSVVRREGFSFLINAFELSERNPGIAGFDLALVGFSLSDFRPITETLNCGAFINYSGWCNSEFESLRTTYVTSLDSAVRDDAVRRMQELFIEESPKFILHFGTNVWGVPRDLANFDGVIGSDTPQVWTGPSNVLIALPVEPDNHNPLYLDTTYESFFTDPVFEPLFSVDADPESASYGQASAILALSVPAPMPTGVGTEHAVTLDLRDSSFSDGHPVDAYDVAFSYQLFLRPESEVNDSEELRALGLTFDAIEVIDTNTLRFRFPQPVPDYAVVFDIPILPMHQWLPHTSAADALAAYTAAIDATGWVGTVPLEGDAFDDGSETFGSGPYMADAGGRWNPSTRTLRLVRNLGSASAVGDVEAVTIRVLSREDVITELAAGASLLVDRNYVFLPAELEDFPGISIFTSPTLDWQEMGANLNSVFLSDVRVRRAIDLALPRQRVIDEVIGGLGTPAHSWVSPASPFSDPDFEEDGLFGPVFDLDNARATMRSAGYATLDADAPVLHTNQAVACNAEAALMDWVEAGEIDQPTADRILADLARSLVGR